VSYVVDTKGNSRPATLVFLAFLALLMVVF
jgi:hypothetical protein